MKNKKLLEESTIRRWGKLANIPVLRESEEQLDEDNFDKSGKGPERPGAGKDGEQKGVAKNQGKDAPDSPDGKLQVPGTKYMGDQKMKNTSVKKKAIDSGTPLVENEEMGDEEDDEDAEMMGGEMEPAEPEMSMEPEMGGDEPLDEPMGDMGAPAGGNEEMFKKVVNAIASALGVDVSIDGEAGEGEMEMEPEMEPEMNGPGPDVAPPSEEEEEEEEENDLSGLATEALIAELEKRGAASEEKEEVAMNEALEKISKRVAQRLISSMKNKK